MSIKLHYIIWYTIKEYGSWLTVCWYTDCMFWTVLIFSCFRHLIYTYAFILFHKHTCGSIKLTDMTWKPVLTTFFHVHVDMVSVVFLHLSGLSKPAGKIHSGCHSRFESFSQDMFGLFSSLHNSEQIKSLYAHILPGLWERGVLQLCGIHSLRREWVSERDGKEKERRREKENEMRLAGKQDQRTPLSASRGD